MILYLSIYIYLYDSMFVCWRVVCAIKMKALALIKIIKMRTYDNFASNQFLVGQMLGLEADAQTSNG